MRLKRLYRGKWEILAPVDEAGCCDVLETLSALQQAKQTRATVAGFVAQWTQIDHFGPRSLGTGIYHRVDDEHEINEFRKRDHRILCFEADGRVIVCSHIIHKKSDKTPTKDKNRAIALKDQYLAAKKLGQLVIEEDDEEENEDDDNA